MSFKRIVLFVTLFSLLEASIQVSSEMHAKVHATYATKKSRQKNRRKTAYGNRDANKQTWEFDLPFLKNIGWTIAGGIIVGYIIGNIIKPSTQQQTSEPPIETHHPEITRIEQISEPPKKEETKHKHSKNVNPGQVIGLETEVESSSNSTNDEQTNELYLKRTPLKKNSVDIVKEKAEIKEQPVIKEPPRKPRGSTHQGFSARKRGSRST